MHWNISWAVRGLKFAAAAAKSLQSCPTLCDPTEGSPPGSPVPGILQARTLEWVAISFSGSKVWVPANFMLWKPNPTHDRLWRWVLCALTCGISVAVREALQSAMDFSITWGLSEKRQPWVRKGALTEGSSLQPCLWASSLQDCEQWISVVYNPLSGWCIFFEITPQAD